MIDLLGDRLPRFTQEEVGLLKGSSEVRHPKDFPAHSLTTHSFTDVMCVIARDLVRTSDKHRPTPPLLSGQLMISSMETLLLDSRRRMAAKSVSPVGFLRNYANI